MEIGMGLPVGNMYFHGASYPRPWEISWDVSRVDPNNMAMPWVPMEGRWLCLGISTRARNVTNEIP